MQPGESLADAERNALKNLDSELNRHGRLNMEAFDLIGFALSRLPIIDVHKVPLPRKIATSLLVKISNDLNIGRVIKLRGSAVSKRAPTVKEINATINNFPFNLISRLSDFNDSRANKRPVIKAVNIPIIR